MAHGLLRIVHSPVRDIKAHFLQQASCGVGTDRIDWYADSERVCVLSCFQREARGVILDSGGDGGGGEDGMNDVEELFAFCVSESSRPTHVKLAIPYGFQLRHAVCHEPALPESPDAGVLAGSGIYPQA